MTSYVYHTDCVYHNIIGNINGKLNNINYIKICIILCMIAIIIMVCMHVCIIMIIRNNHNHYDDYYVAIF